MRCLKCGCIKDYRRNVSDEDLEYLKQQVELGDADALQQLLDEGELDPHHVALAAYLGDPLALQVSESWDDSSLPGWANIKEFPKTRTKARNVIYFGELDEKLLVSCSADFAEHVLHIFEDIYPDDNRPRLAIQAVRDYIVGIKGLRSYIRDAADAATDAARSSADDSAWAAAYAAAYAARAVDSNTSWDNASDAIYFAAVATNNIQLEAVWQTQRLINYLLKRVELRKQS